MDKVREREAERETERETETVRVRKYLILPANGPEAPFSVVSMLGPGVRHRTQNLGMPYINIERQRQRQRQTETAREKESESYDLERYIGHTIHVIMYMYIYI
jgi:hypothetical protein